MDIGNVIAAVVVLGVLGAVFGFVLAVASKVFEVKKDPREEEILSHLAGANCGGCGFPGCAGCAAAILAGTAPVNACAPAGAENAAAIAKIMGQEAPSGERKVAFVRCNGGTNAAKRYEYVGVKDCLSATKVAGGPLECQFGCLGFGDCVAVCAFDAIHINPETGLPEVDADKCTACGACVKACPKMIIELRKKWPKNRAVYVSCVSKEKGAVVMKACKAGCIGCGKCVKVCAFDAITVENNLAYIDPQKCKLCRKCVNECPTGAIRLVGMDPLPKAPKAPATPATPAAPKAGAAPKVEN